MLPCIHDRQQIGQKLFVEKLGRTCTAERMHAGQIIGPLDSHATMAQRQGLSTVQCSGDIRLNKHQITTLPGRFQIESSLSRDGTAQATRAARGRSNARLWRQPCSSNGSAFIKPGGFSLAPGDFNAYIFIKHPERQQGNMITQPWLSGIFCGIATGEMGQQPRCNRFITIALQTLDGRGIKLNLTGQQLVQQLGIEHPAHPCALS